jgi:hypothetical protein
LGHRQARAEENEREGQEFLRNACHRISPIGQLADCSGLSCPNSSPFGVERHLGKLLVFFASQSAVSAHPAGVGLYGTVHVGTKTNLMSGLRTYQDLGWHPLVVLLVVAWI